jgi:hypothetical protein
MGSGMGEKNQRFVQVLLAIICMLVVIGLAACPPPERFEGTYVAEESESSPHPGAILELKDDSEGTFRSQEQEVTFRWSVRGHEIRFHTKEGGVIIGEIRGDTLTVTLPSDRVMTFKKKSNY